MKRAYVWIVLAVFCPAALWTALTVPPRAASLPAVAAAQPSTPVVRGAYHVHSTESDGTGSVAQIADAARRAGLDFVILTDHADGSQPIRPPRYYGGVLCVEAMEVSTDNGHYAVLGIDNPPYRLGGEGRDVAADVARLGGFGVVAHPDSAKPDLQWTEWDMPVGGFEWFNADSQWRDERRLALVPALLHYAVRSPETVASLFDRPVEALAHWDRLASRGHVVGLAAADAHARLGFRGRVDPYEDALYVPLPSYEAVFRAFSLHVELDEPFEGRAPQDARRLVDAVRAGRVVTAFEALASPAQIVFEGEAAGDRSGPGGDVPRVTPITFRVRSNAPSGATTVIVCDGKVVHETDQPDVEWQTMLAGAFRAEVRLPRAPGQPPVPWIVTNPIYVGVPAGPAPGPPPPAPPTASWPYTPNQWAVEQDEGSQGRFEVLSPAESPLLASLSYRLAPAPAASPYVAAVTYDVGPLFEADRLTFQASAMAPMRLSVQFRSSSGGRERRWRRSVYLDPTPREVTVPFADARGVDDAKGSPLAIRDVTSLLFVVDTVNALPGTSGAVTLVNLRAER